MTLALKRLSQLAKKTAKRSTKRSAKKSTKKSAKNQLLGHPTIFTRPDYLPFLETKKTGGGMMDTIRVVWETEHEIEMVETTAEILIFEIEIETIMLEIETISVLKWSRHRNVILEKRIGPRTSDMTRVT